MTSPGALQWNKEPLEARIWSERDKLKRYQPVSNKREFAQPVERFIDALCLKNKHGFVSIRAKIEFPDDAGLVQLIKSSRLVHCEAPAAQLHSSG